ncbi:MAG: helix-turn-helix transcriptional regulator [Lentisphaeria bacterium]|nr:helix-turn-helix transcriptional regulator [Lentisphaeria bacterium]
MHDISKHWENAIIIQALYREFRYGENYHYPLVQSCYIAGCLTGRGRIKVNNQLFDIAPGKVVFAPWNHTITYIPDPDAPYVLACIHLIPDAREHGDIRYNAFHTLRPEHPLYLLRQNEVVDKFNRAACRSFAENSHFFNLMRYAIDYFLEQATEDQLRLMARLFFYEIYTMLHTPEEKMPQIPVTLRRMLNHIDDYMELPIDMQQLSFHSNLSPASIYRMFRKYLNVTPQRYIIRQRLLHAARVMRQSTISITSLARNLQFSTPGNFSRAFKEEFGISPRQFRENPAAIPESPKLLRPPRHIDDKLNPHFTPKFIPESEL